jgi:hypothetical protein
MARIPVPVLARSRWGRPVAFAAILLLTGCAQQVACTTVGCSSQVVVDVHALAGRIGSKPFQAVLCVQGDCQMQAGTIAGGTAMLTVVKQIGVNGGPTFDPTKPVPVTLRVTTRDGAVVTDAAGTATLHPVRPNGPSCGPVCYQATLTLSGSSLAEVAAS